MKIDRQNPSLDTEALRPAASSPAKTAHAAAHAAAPSTSGGDTVDVSGAAHVQQLVSRTVAAVMADLDGGPQAVARAKAVFASGALGQDPAALADAIIDDLIRPS